MRLYSAIERNGGLVFAFAFGFGGKLTRGGGIAVCGRRASSMDVCGRGRDSCADSGAGPGGNGGCCAAAGGRGFGGAGIVAVGGGAHGETEGVVSNGFGGGIVFVAETRGSGIGVLMP